jgi:hypothetical protein
MSHATLLIGSPKPKASASRNFAEAVSTRLEASGWTTGTERITPAFSDEARMRALLDAIAKSDLVVLAFPVYVDSLPAPVLRLLESWKAAIDAGEIRSATTGRQQFAVLTQCGFPEAKHCDVAIEVCRLFAAEAGLEWAGALAFGMGGAIEHNPLDRSMLTRRLPEFDAAVAALAAGEAIPESATATFRRPLTPAWSYPLAGGSIWKRQARKQGCSEPLTLKRYAQ